MLHHQRPIQALLNHEEQYSIWRAYHEIPLGWREEGKMGTRNECLGYIETVWTDMRPKSVRRQLGEL